MIVNEVTTSDKIYIERNEVDNVKGFRDTLGVYWTYNEAIGLARTEFSSLDKVWSSSYIKREIKLNSSRFIHQREIFINKCQPNYMPNFLASTKQGTKNC